MDAIKQFSEAIRSAGYFPNDEITANVYFDLCGEWDGATPVGWGLIYGENFDNAAKLNKFGCFGMYGDYRRGQAQFWYSGYGPPSMSDYAAFSLHAKRSHQKALERRDLKLVKAAQIAKSIWDESTPATDRNPFLLDHEINAYGARMAGDDLIVPLTDINRNVHSLQYISRHEFLENGLNDGHFFLIGRLGETICVVADFESGASIHQATELPVAVAFDYENFQPVVAAIKVRRPKATIILCDRFFDDGGSAPEGWTLPDWMKGCRKAVPDFGGKGGSMDYSFNDLHQLIGLDAVKRDVLAALASGAVTGQPAPSGSPEIAPTQRQHVFNFQPASKFAARPPQRWVIDDVLPALGCGAIYGQTKAAKSFLLLDMFSAICTGSHWFGHSVIKTPLVYLCLEGDDGLGKRVQACTDRYGADVGAAIQVSKKEFQLNDPAQVRDLGLDIVEAVGHGAIVAIDTLSLAIPGVDENSSGGMSSALAGCKELQRLTKGMIVLVHHAGKETGRGMRGHSNLFAGLDVAIEVTHLDGERRQWRIQKLRDGGDSVIYPFRLEVVEVDTDAVGKPITSCVVVPIEGVDGAVLREPKGKKQPGPRGANQKAVHTIAVELVRQSQSKGQGGAPAEWSCIRLDDLIAGCRGKLNVASDREPERIQMAVQGLVAGGFLKTEEGWAWIP